MDESTSKHIIKMYKKKKCPLCLGGLDYTIPRHTHPLGQMVMAWAYECPHCNSQFVLYSKHQILDGYIALDNFTEPKDN